ncbi:MAG: HAD hydrolase-like protein [Minisyncoccia bacterium]
MTLIIDFNRTLYDPETDALMDGALALLTYAKNKSITMHLLSKREEGRERRIEGLGIAAFFTSIIVTNEKEPELRRLIEHALDPVFVLGDHLHNEIRLGNRYGAKTLWLRRGKFKHLRRESPEDVPWQTIETLEDAMKHL